MKEESQDVNVSNEQTHLGKLEDSKAASEKTSIKSGLTSSTKGSSVANASGKAFAEILFEISSEEPARLESRSQNTEVQRRNYEWNKVQTIVAAT